MKRILLTILAMAVLPVLSVLTACGTISSNDVSGTNESGVLPPAQQQGSSATPDGSDAAENAAPEQETSEITITLTVNGRTFSATLLDNETVRQFAEQFPLTLNMSELNGNEKYFYMDKELPTDTYQPGQISAGDLMLYGNNCLVLFYESSSSGYSYTRLGRVDDPAGLAEALGAGSVEAVFSVR